MISKEVLVFGSINMDLVARVPRLPQPGETLQGDRFTTTSGGKGANQAIAAARLGASTTLVGRVGKDGFGSALMTHLKRNGVNGDAISADSNTSTGIAQILVDDAGQSQIVIIGGANQTVGDSELAYIEQHLSNIHILLLQLEIPLPQVIAAAKLAQTAGAITVLDPAPAPDQLPRELYSVVDLLTPNETEARRLVRFPVTDPDSAAIAAKALHQKGVPRVIITLGDRGSFYSSPGQQFWTPAVLVDVVDTVAAGDAFNGAIAAALATATQPWESTIRFATLAAALACTQTGAQTSLPTRQAVQALEQRSRAV